MTDNNTDNNTSPAVEAVPSVEATPTAKVKKNKSSTGKRGRPATVSDKAFMEVHAKSKSLDDIINAFKNLREMDPKKARLYVTMRSTALRRKGMELKTFPRGRQSTPKANEPVVETATILEE